VLPPISYPPVLAPCAANININTQIMQTYLEDILPGKGAALCWGGVWHGVGRGGAGQGCVSVVGWDGVGWGGVGWAEVEWDPIGVTWGLI
jgi:hypothetical protein